MPHTDLKEIKHLFMTYRNGIVADTLRKAGEPFGVIFGLQLPQLSEIARQTGKSAELADSLWADSNVRESRLLACWVYPPEEISMEKAVALASGVITREEADILAFRLLRYLPFAAPLAETLLGLDEPLPHYVGVALTRNLQS